MLRTSDAESGALLRDHCRYRHRTVSDAPSSPDDDAALSGSGLEAERVRRQARVDELRGQGTNPYPYRFDRTHSLGEIRERWGAAKVCNTNLIVYF